MKPKNAIERIILCLPVGWTANAEIPGVVILEGPESPKNENFKTQLRRAVLEKDKNAKGRFGA